MFSEASIMTVVSFVLLLGMEIFLNSKVILLSITSACSSEISSLNILPVIELSGTSLFNVP